MKKILLLVLILILAACSVSSEYDQNIKKWQEAGVSHYRFDLFVVCFCPFRDLMPLTIEVQNGEVVSITKPDGTALESSDPSYAVISPVTTIEGLFAQVESSSSGESGEVLVTYDTLYGYPVTISIDPIKEAIDDEISYQVENFEALP